MKPLTNEEMNLVAEALHRAAIRQESESRQKDLGKVAALRHAEKARKYRTLIEKLTSGAAIAAILALSISSVAPAPAQALPAAPHAIAQLYTPAPENLVHKAGCVAYQVCQTCYKTDMFGNTTTYQCSCHMECLPGVN